MNDNGWIKLHRAICDWEWYRDIYVKSLFLHLLLKANHAEKKWQGIMVKRGQIISSIEILGSEIGMSIQQVRTALKKLEKTGEIVRQATSRYTMLTLVNYEKYQEQLTNEQQTSNKQLTNEQQTSNKQSTTNKNVKNDKNDKNDKNKEFDRFWEKYPKKTSRPQALKTWEKLNLDKNIEEILEGIDRSTKYDSRFREYQFIPHPSSWLNSTGWKDEFGEGAKNGIRKNVSQGFVPSSGFKSATSG